MKKICLIILFLFSLGSIIGLRKGVTPTASADSAPAETVEVITITPTIDTFLNMSPGASAPAPDGQFFFVGADEFDPADFWGVVGVGSAAGLGVDVLDRDHSDLVSRDYAALV